MAVASNGTVGGLGTFVMRWRCCSVVRGQCQVGRAGKFGFLGVALSVSKCFDGAERRFHVGEYNGRFPYNKTFRVLRKCEARVRA